MASTEAVERASSFRRLALLMPSSLLSSTSVAITLAPSAANAAAIARPRPCPAAVTSATLPCRRFAIRSFLRHRHINGIRPRLVHAGDREHLVVRITQAAHDDVSVIVSRHALLCDPMIFDRRFEHHAVGELVNHGALDLLPWSLR